MRKAHFTANASHSSRPFLSWSGSQGFWNYFISRGCSFSTLWIGMADPSGFPFLWCLRDVVHTPEDFTADRKTHTEHSLASPLDFASIFSCMKSEWICSSFYLSSSGQNFSRFLSLPSSSFSFIHPTSEVQEIIQHNKILEAFYYQEPPFIMGLDMIHGPSLLCSHDSQDTGYPNACYFYLSD